MHIKVVLDNGATKTISGDSWAVDNAGALHVLKDKETLFSSSRGTWDYVEKID